MENRRLITLSLSEREAAMLAAAMRATLEELDDDDFSTRVALTTAHARALLEQLDEARSPVGLAIEIETDVLAMAALCLNEVLRGFRPPDFSLIGDRDEVKRLERHLESLA